VSREKQSILIIDDERFNIDILSMEFSPEYEILIAKEGRQALKRLENRLVDLILLDIVMPEMNGYEIIKLIKNNERTKDIPVIFITSKNEIEDEAIGLQLGAVDYIRKPFNIPIVRARVKTQLDLKLKTDLLERLVSLDGLTGIYNRRKVDEVLQNEWKRTSRSGSPLSIVLIDIDFFKRYNDNYGHTAGDECLRKVAQELQVCLKRPEDFVGRYGGEEFIVLLPNTIAEGAKHVAERLRKAIETLNLTHRYSSVADRVTISLGISTAIPDTTCESPAFLLETADRMLYESKEHGRNRVRCKEISLSNG
jgi:diguanylate cyclase (GGDEF)-like protein